MVSNDRGIAMPFGLISEEACKQQIERIRGEHRREMDRVNAAHQEEVEGLRKLVAESGIIKARGRMPDKTEDRYTIQVYADSITLHTLVRQSDRKQFVNLLSEQFSHMARQMLLALSGLERIPMLPYYPERPEEWWMLDERGKR